jgi:hypothetical protein
MVVAWQISRTDVIAECGVRRVVVGDVVWCGRRQHGPGSGMPGR